VRSAVVTLLVACAVGLATFVGGWAVQAASLPPPEKGDRVAARAVAWLLRYRLVESSFRIGRGPVLHGRCLEGWFPSAGGRVDRGTLLRLDDGVSLVAVAPHDLEIDGAPDGEPHGLPLAQLELAGCSRVLAPLLGGLVQSGRSVRVAPAFAAGRAALAVRIPTARTRIVLYLAPKTDRPIAVAVSGERYAGRGRIRLTRLTPGLLHLIEGRP
jgi:hypothetical protein